MTQPQGNINNNT